MYITYFWTGPSTEIEQQDPETTTDISEDTKQAYGNNQNSAYKACSSQTSSLVLLWDASGQTCHVYKIRMLGQVREKT